MVPSPEALVGMRGRDTGPDKHTPTDMLQLSRFWELRTICRDIASCLSLI